MPSPFMGHGEASPPATNTFCDCQVTAPTLEEKEGRKRQDKSRGKVPFLPLVVEMNTPKSKELQFP